MASSVSWMSFDAEQQRRTQLVMAALSEQGTIDELGLGIARDLVSSTILPGIVNPMQRAKYLLLVPRDYANLASRTTEALLEEGRRREARTVADLKRAHAGDLSGQGIIGGRTGEDTRRLASSIYWGLLQQLKILEHRGSVADYCRSIAQVRAAEHVRSSLQGENDVADARPTLWAELPDEPDAPLGLELGREEAEWLRDRFLATDERSVEDQSLMTWHLQPGRPWVSVSEAWEHPDADQFPASTGHVVMLGRDLDTIVHGARILYNYLCADRRPDPGDQRDHQLRHYGEAMQEWRDGPIPDADRLVELDEWGRRTLAQRRASGATRVRWRTTIDFVRTWRDLAERSGDLLRDAAAAELVTRREARLKGPRARLTRLDELRGWPGGSSYGRFRYNWDIARRFLDDIHHGLGTPTREVAP